MPSNLAWAKLDRFGSKVRYENYNHFTLISRQISAQYKIGFRVWF